MQASNSYERQPEEEPLLPGGGTISSSWLCSKDVVEVYCSPSANRFGIRRTRWSSAASVWSVSCLLLALVCMESALPCNTLQRTHEGGNRSKAMRTVRCSPPVF